MTADAREITKVNKEKVLTWSITLITFIGFIISSYFQLSTYYTKNPQEAKIFQSLLDSFSNVSILYSYFVWIVFLTIYGILNYYEKVQKRHPKRTTENLVEKNYYLTLWFWGISAIIIQHTNIITDSVEPLHFIGDKTIIRIILSSIIGIGGILLLVIARVHLDGYWTTDIYKYENHKVINKGVYSIVRHPIYAGQIYITISIFLAYNNYWTIFLPLLTIIYNVRRAKKEEDALCEITNGKYLEYKKNTPNSMFFTL